MVLFDRIKIWKCRVYDKEEKQVNPGKNSPCKAENLIKHSTQEGVASKLVGKDCSSFYLLKYSQIGKKVTC